MGDRGMTDNKSEVTVTAADLRLLLRAVLPHAGRTCHPLLNSVRVEYEPGALWTAATDRYTLAAQRVLVAASSTANAAVAVTIGRGDARRILRHIGPPGPPAPIQLTIAADGLTLARAGSRLHVPSVDGNYPDWRKLIGRYLHRSDPAAVPALGINPAMLGRHKQAWKLHRKRNLNTDAAAVLIPPGRQDEPLVVTIGDHYVGLQMPRRPGAQHTPVPPPPLLAAFPAPDGHSVINRTDQPTEAGDR
jgi:hypothetical protein